MTRRHLLVQLYPKTPLVGRYYVAVFPSDRFLDKLCVEAAEPLDALLDQEVGAAGANLYSRSIANGFQPITCRSPTSSISPATFSG